MSGSSSHCLTVKSKTYKEVEQIIGCPICFEMATSPIYQCQNGHIVCSACIDLVTACPMCRADLPETKIRNLPAEQLTGTLTMHCKYQEDGCQFIVKLKDYAHHLAHECLYEDHSFCKRLGSKCRHKVSWQDFPAHIVNCTAHKLTTFSESDPLKLLGVTRGVIGYQVYERNLLRNSFCNWEPIFMLHDGKVFSILSRYNHSDQTIAWSCVIHDEVERTSKLQGDYLIEITLQQPAKGTKKLQWIGEVLHMKDFKNGISPSAFRIAVSVIQEDFSEDKLKYNLIKLFRWSVHFLIKRKSDEHLSGQVDTELTTQPSLAYFCPYSRVDEDDCDCHFGIMCGQCGANPIKGIRYKCVECPDCNYCASCEKTGIHDYHLLIRISSPDLSDRLMNLAHLLEFSSLPNLEQGPGSQNVVQHIRYHSFFERQYGIWIEDTGTFYNWVKSLGAAFASYFKSFNEKVDGIFPILLRLDD